MNIFKIFSSLFNSVFPHYMVKQTQWYSAWKEQQQNDNISVWRASLPVFAFGYAIHIYIDILHQKPDIEMWITFRVAMTALALFCLALYFWPVLYKSRFYKVPIYVFVFIACYFQARTVLWYPLIPYSLALNFVFFGALILRGSIAESILFATVMISFQWPTLMEAGVLKVRLISESVLTGVIIVFARTSFANEVKSFVLGQKRQEAQKELLRLSQEYTEQIKGFLPREIARRLTVKMETEKMSAFEAMQAVLIPKQIEVACLYSDVRGFTAQCRDLEGFVQNSLLPNLEAATEAIEQNQGIPRKVGDLLFSYFDFLDPKENIIRALKSGVQLIEINTEHNALHPKLKIKRHTLLSFGSAIVGNLSSNHSAIEISAIGNSVNFLSRVDEISKLESFKKLLKDIDIIMSEEAHTQVCAIFPNVETTKICLEKLNICIRNFSEVKNLYILPVNAFNRSIIMEESDQMSPIRKVA